MALCFLPLLLFIYLSMCRIKLQIAAVCIVHAQFHTNAWHFQKRPRWDLNAKRLGVREDGRQLKTVSCKKGFWHFCHSKKTQLHCNISVSYRNTSPLEFRNRRDCDLVSQHSRDWMAHTNLGSLFQTVWIEHLVFCQVTDVYCSCIICSFFATSAEPLFSKALCCVALSFVLFYTSWRPVWQI